MPDIKIKVKKDPGAENIGMLYVKTPIPRGQGLEMHLKAMTSMADVDTLTVECDGGVGLKEVSPGQWELLLKP